MNKEIHEEPTALHETISPRINERGEIVLDGVTVTKEQLKKCNKIYIVGCGSAYHVGIVGKYIIERMARIPVEVDLASEFRYREPIIDENTLYDYHQPVGRDLPTPLQPCARASAAAPVSCPS